MSKQNWKDLRRPVDLLIIITALVNCWAVTCSGPYIFLSAGSMSFLFNLANTVEHGNGDALLVGAQYIVFVKLRVTARARIYTIENVFVLTEAKKSNLDGILSITSLSREKNFSLLNLDIFYLIES